MAKHAYLILAHKNFGQLRKLIELLDHPRNDIYLHVDAKATDFDFDAFKDAAKASKLEFLPRRIKIMWGGFSSLKAELALLKAATDTEEYDYYHLLSGMDLPIKSQDKVHEFFDANKGKEFISLWPMKKSNISRFSYYTIFPEGESMFGTRIINHIFKGLQMAVGHKINRGIDFYIGANWFSITHELARFVIENEQWLENTFRHTSNCDELFLQTLVCNSLYRERLFCPEPTNQKEFNQSNMRFIDWTRGESVRHPWTFRAGDYDLLMNRNELWARKFDETVDSEIIDKIYNKLKS